ncbi:hypothetical protein [Streptomyces sp. NPDC088789]|uniref:hypothetical protein n=1 Tax=Streptomyces sp. NPDC088789 TaxID=3365899 RepID=UPI003827438C
MGGWITVGWGAVAAMCPLSPDSGAGVVVDSHAGAAHVVVCAPDAWIEIGASAPTPVEEPGRVTGEERAVGPSPRVAPTEPATEAAPAVAEAVAPAPAPAVTSAPSAAPVPAAVPEPPEVVAAPVAREVPAAFRWVPRPYRGGAGERSVPGGFSVLTTMTVITTPAILAAAALRPGSRRRRS